MWEQQSKMRREAKRTGFYRQANHRQGPLQAQQDNMFKKGAKSIFKKM